MVGSMEGSRFNGNKVESFKERERKSEIARERESDRYFEAQTVRNGIRVFQN